ncbi:ammonium transporter [Protofrankia sp. BMG5.30]|uniref:ammonium transporter n=1 Tax=Protofrankia sp. BMG5.30 TaxID=1834514 RepID=UPI000975BBEF|nr:ammonium transporter [Protofrankia sp. BMG5.30]ONH34004.1 ammonium transporter [Protofrankia sp. BMG5.30]
MAALDTGDTAWILASSGAVLLMTPGLAFFYGGMVRAKNVLGILVQNFFTIGIVTLVWTVVGYSIAFGSGNKFWGGFDFVGLQDLTASDTTIPAVVFVSFQMMFAIITPALITGASADRIKFSAFAVFVVLWSVLVYSPIAHWVWASTGWLYKRGALDFAGGTVVHANAGIAAIVLAVALGKRRGWPAGDFRPHNVPFVLLGTGLLWFGWFGFNAGSALGANKVAGYAFLNTQIATGVALLGWIAVERLRDGKATALGAASGAVAGLVAITPACGFVSPLGSIAVGAIAGVVCALATAIKGRVGIDDSLDVGAVHLIGGVLGALLTGLFATVDTNPNGKDGVFYGGPWSVFGEQALAVGATVAYSAVATAIIAYAIKFVWGLRVSDEEEEIGLDESQHGETAYRLTFTGGGTGTGGASGSATPVQVSEEVKA